MKIDNTRGAPPPNRFADLRPGDVLEHHGRLCIKVKDANGTPFYKGRITAVDLDNGGLTSIEPDALVRLRDATVVVRS